MDQKVIDKELAQELMKIKGETRGVALKVDWDFVLRKEGKEGVEKLEAKMAGIGCPIKYKDIKTMNFYPVGLDAISILAIKEVFGWGDKEIEEMGGAVVKFSIFLRVFMKYFRTLPMVAKEVPKVWREHYSIGELKVTEINEVKKYIIARLEDFHIHPVVCIVLRGYFARTMGLIVKSLVHCQETKCTFCGDAYHEFLLRW